MKKKQKFQFADRIEVLWRDTSGGASWQSLHDPFPTPPVVSQMGYFVAYDDQTLHICQGVPNRKEGDITGCQILGMSGIPTGCVVSIRKVR